MIKWAKIIDENTKAVSVGLGNNSSYYESIGMTQMDVEQSYDGSWYVAGYAPEEPDAEKKAKRKAELIAQLAEIDEKEIRPLAAIVAGTATEEDRQRLANYEEQKAAIRAEIQNIDADLTEFD